MPIATSDRPGADKSGQTDDLALAQIEGNVPVALPVGKPSHGEDAPASRSERV